MRLVMYCAMHSLKRFVLRWIIQSISINYKTVRIKHSSKKYLAAIRKKKKPEKKSALNAKVKGRKNDTHDSIQVRFIDTSVRYFWCWCIHLHQEAKNAKPASPRNDRNHADRSKYPQ